jgi:hypothetical protein
MTSKLLLRKLRALAEEAQQAGLRQEARTLFATELVMEQQMRDSGEQPEEWAGKSELQAFIVNRVIHAEPQAQGVH